MFQIKNHSFISNLSGREYVFHDDVSRRHAAGQLLIDDNRLKTAANSRAQKIVGRDLTDAEHHGLKEWMPDNRTLEQKIKEDALIVSQPTPDPSRNPYVAAVSELMKATPILPSDKAKQRSRIAMLESKAREWDRDHAARAAQEAKMNAPEVTAAVASARTLHETLRLMGDIPDAWVRGAKDRLDSLERTGDVQAFQAMLKEFDAEKVAFEAENRANIEQQIADLKSQLE